MDAALVLSLPEEVTVASVPDGSLRLSSPHAHIVLRQPDCALREAVHRLVAPGDAAGRLAEHIRLAAGSIGLGRWYYHLQDLAWRRMLHLSVWANDEHLVTLQPTGSSFVLPSAGLEPGQTWVLSRFAWTQRRGEELVLESPLTAARIVLHDARAAMLVYALSRPGTVQEVGTRVPNLTDGALQSMLGLLVHLRAVTAVGVEGTTEDEDPSLRCWQFHDLLFHARSRPGKQDGVVGASFPLAGKVDPPPALKRWSGGEGIDLERPDLEERMRQDPPFGLVQERRRSLRRYGAEPITVSQLGEYLYRVARVKGCEKAEIATPAGPIPMDFAPRPYPAGGALYELDMYVVVRSCRGLNPGIYGYDGLEHRLMVRVGRTRDVDAVLADAAMAAGIDSASLQILIVLVARVPRVAWKYTGLAYALVLKHVGVVFQTMYLTATAMGLAPCALGTGDSERFARAAGLTEYDETSVGEFLLGSV